MSLSKTTKVALILQYHTMIEPVDEDALMLMISWIINGIDDGRFDWEIIIKATQGE